MKKYKIKNKIIVFEINEFVYSKEILLKTSYEFIDRCFIYIDKCKDCFVVELEFKQDGIEELDVIAGMFWNELLCQQMRAMISKETKNVRELILTRALYSSYLEVAKPDSISNKNEYSVESIAKDWFSNE